MKDTAEKGFSAARAGKVNRRAAAQRKIAEPATYNVYDGKTGEKFNNCKLSRVREMCPGLNVSTLQRRLHRGERNLVELRKPAAPSMGRRRPAHVKPKVK